MPRGDNYNQLFKYNMDLMDKRIKEYNLNPKLCKQCKNPIPYAQRINIFCSQSCSAIFTNIHYDSKHKRLPQKFCKNCGGLCKKRREFCSIKCRTISEFKERMKDPSYVPGKSVIRKYVLLTRDCICEKCRHSTWMGLPIPLEIHHKDGNYKNNQDNNIELICPNCHVLTDTYKGKNKSGNGRPR